MRSLHFEGHAIAFRLITLNLNGIRSAASKGFVEWAEKAGADCMGVQELKAQAVDLQGRFDTVAGMRGHFHYAQKKGYSGVGIYARHEPSDVLAGFGCPEFDDEGRWIELRFDTPARKLSLISCYFPSGSAGEHRQASKFRFLGEMYPYLVALEASREFILMGDVNIAHHEIDLRNWRGNQKNSGFLPEERAWMTRLLEAGGLVDVFRRINDRPDQYTWWSNRGQARAKNVGWRIDYHLATPALAALARPGSDSIFKGAWYSDHAPLAIDYDLTL